MTKLKKDDSAMRIKLRELNKKIKETFLETKVEKKVKKTSKKVIENKRKVK